VLTTQRKVLEANGVAFAAPVSQIHFGVGKLVRVEFEPCCEIRAGHFAIGRIGAFSYLGGSGRSIFRNVSSIGRFCSIAPEVHIGAIEHPTDFLSAHKIFQGRWHVNHPPVADFINTNPFLKKSQEIYHLRYSDEASLTRVGNDVWIGEGTFIRRGITIGDGAIIAARSVVTHDVPAYCIVGGVPARVIRPRFDEDIIERLLQSKWWEYGFSAIKTADFTNPKSALDSIEEAIASGAAQRYQPDISVLSPDGEVSIIPYYPIDNYMDTLQTANSKQQTANSK